MNLSWLSIQGLENLIVSYGFPTTYLWVVPLVLIVTAIPFMVAGQKAWASFIGIGGLGIGFYISVLYIVPYLQYPPYLIEIPISIITAIILYFAVRYGISAAIGYLGYYVAMHQTFYPLTMHSVTITGYNIHPVPIVIGFIIMGIAFWKYKKISVYIAGFLGFLGMYFGLGQYIGPYVAVAIAGILFAIGQYWQFMRPRIKRGSSNAS